MTATDNREVITSKYHIKKRATKTEEFDTNQNLLTAYFIFLCFLPVWQYN
jgi:hypothetical protein